MGNVFPQDIFTCSSVLTLQTFIELMRMLRALFDYKSIKNLDGN